MSNLFNYSLTDFFIYILVIQTESPTGAIDLSGCGKTKGCYRIPAKCATENKCDKLVTWADKGDRVQFELSGIATGWVGLGFSKDEKMVGTCLR